MTKEEPWAILQKRRNTVKHRAEEVNSNLLAQFEDLRERILDEFINEMQNHAVEEILAERVFGNGSAD